MPPSNAAVQCNGLRDGKTEEIVISGISGRYPESDSVEEFKQNLYSGVDLVSSDGRRWTPGLWGTPVRNGKIKDLKHFDADFFGIDPEQANVMDPSLRLLHETTFEAIVDAGYNPADLRGSRIAVITALTASEAAQYWSSKPDQVNGYGMLGCHRHMFSNQISYAFDFNGPSYNLDSACSSGMIALQNGYEAIRSGQCDAAIIGGLHLNIKPMETLALFLLGLLSEEGTCRVFDNSGKGYTRSEAVVTVFLQKRSAARRVYSTIAHAGLNADGHKPQGVTYPSSEVQKALLRRTFKEGKLNPLDVSYVEAHGTGTKAADPAELDAVSSFFCPGRKEPLLVGGVKSNTGHTESSSGLVSIQKVIFAMEGGIIPGNLHFNEPNKDIPSLFDGRIQVVDKNTPWKEGMAAINSFGFGGANAHLVLRPNQIKKAQVIPEGKEMPRLITISGRTEEAAHAILDQVEWVREDEGFLSLLSEIYKNNIKGHKFRGYALLDGEKMSREVAEFDGEKRPVWWIFSGMGSQWPGMGKALYRLEVFRNSMHKCAAALKPHGVDLIDIVLNATTEVLESCTNSFVAITATQIALVDTLTSLGIKPDFFAGHSVGELGCAYADDTLTTEQTILASFYRGRAFEESGIAHNAMAAVGLSWEETMKRAPPEVIPACHNAAYSVSVSGTKEAIAKFVAELQAEGIFAKEVKTAGIGAHSRYVYDSVPLLKNYFKELIPNPKPRSARWISSSIPEARLGEPIAKLSSLEYHINNITSPVLFADVLEKIPQNAITIEIAPDWLFQSIIKRTLGSNAINVGLSKRYHPENLSFFLSSMGKLYNAGLQFNMSSLGKPAQYPVPRGTQQIASLIKWDHSQEWAVPDFESLMKESGENAVRVDLTDEKDGFLAGNSINGQVIYPASGYIALVWRTFAKLQGASAEDCPVTIENIQFHRQIIMPKEDAVEFAVTILDGSGRFEVCEGGTVVVSGRVAPLKATAHSCQNLPAPDALRQSGVKLLTSSDVYKEFRLHGCDYADLFCGITASNNDATVGRLQWANEWISFMDTMFQFYTLGVPGRKIFLPAFIERIHINPERHKTLVGPKSKSQANLDIVINRHANVIQAGGVEIHGLQTRMVPRKLSPDQAAPKLERYVFVPLNHETASDGKGDMERVAVITSLLQLVSENSGGALKLKVVEIEGHRGSEALIAPLAIRIFASEPVITLDFILSSNEPLPESLADLGVKKVNADKSGPFESLAGTHLVITTDLSERTDPSIWKRISESLKPGCFVLAEETTSAGLSVPPDYGFVVISKLKADKYSYTLLRKIIEATPAYNVIMVNSLEMSWVEPLKKALKESKAKGERILLVSQGDESSGLKGLTLSLKKEPGGLNVRSVLIQDPQAPAFSVTAPLYAKQLELDLFSNVLFNAARNEWGTYRHVPLDTPKDVAPRRVECAYLKTISQGDHTSLCWVEGLPTSHRSGKEICSVSYAPINFYDIEVSDGISNCLSDKLADQDRGLGVEFSGYDSRGRRVMGLVASGSLATSVVTDSTFLWEVPASWTLQQAATVPLSYAISYYALVVRGGMRQGESFLICDGAGDIGQAAIDIALKAGCTVYTTICSQEQRVFLKKRFPELPDNHIANSNFSVFEQGILKATNGRGVDLLLTSSSEQHFKVLARCLAKCGRFLDLLNIAPFDVGAFRHNIYHRIVPEGLFETSDYEKAEIVRLVFEGISNGTVRPLPSTVFSKHRVQDAFKFASAKQQVEKVLIEVRPEKDTPNAASILVPAVPRIYMDPSKSYVLVGGIGGIGLELADWLISRGATKIVITSRSGVKTGYQALCLSRWSRPGVKVIVSSADARTAKGAQQLLSECNQLGPVGGIFNLAAVMRDAFMENQTVSDFLTVTTPKICGTINLDKVSRSLCPQLDHFVVFSSTTAGRGLDGQCPYGLANSGMERICEVRRADGLPATAIQWGVIGDVGLVIEEMGGSNETLLGGQVPQRIASCLNVLDTLLQQPEAVVCSMVVADKGRSTGSSDVEIVEAVAKVFGIKDVKTVRANQTFADLGIDSIMGTEIRDMLQRNYGILVNAEEILGLSFSSLLSLSEGDSFG